MGFAFFHFVLAITQTGFVSTDRLALFIPKLPSNDHLFYLVWSPFRKVSLIGWEGGGCVVVQLVEWSLLTPGILISNPVTSRSL